MNLGNQSYTIEEVMEIVKWYGSLETYNIMVQSETPTPKRTAVERQLMLTKMKNDIISSEKQNLLEKQNKLMGIGECIKMGLITEDEQLQQLIEKYRLQEYDHMLNIPAKNKKR